MFIEVYICPCSGDNPPELIFGRIDGKLDPATPAGLTR
jgi:hypothetical protein